MNRHQPPQNAVKTRIFPAVLRSVEHVAFTVALSLVKLGIVR